MRTRIPEMSFLTDDGRVALLDLGMIGPMFDYLGLDHRGGNADESGN